jgi:K+-sensing histidine kinase KdpD
VTSSVSDAGPGVPAELRSRLFDRYARGADSQGTGLGRAIVRGLARANGGDAYYKRDATTGGAFRVRLPEPGSALTMSDHKLPPMTGLDRQRLTPPTRADRSHRPRVPAASAR